MIYNMVDLHTLYFKHIPTTFMYFNVLTIIKISNEI